MFGKCKHCIKKQNQKDYKSKRTSRGIVYCLECEGFYKIGVTSWSIKNRLPPTQTGNPFEVRILWVKRTNNIGKHERMIHKQLEQNRVRGEWFDIPRVLALELKNIVTHDDV